MGMEKFNKTISGHGNKVHTHFDGGRKVVGVEDSSGEIVVTYDQRGTLEGKNFKSYSEFSKASKESK